MDLAALVQDIIDHHHVPLRADLARMTDALADAPEALRQPWGDLRGLLESHMDKEEKIVFPHILTLVTEGAAAGVGVLGPIEQMRYEHGFIGGLIEQLRTLVDQAGAAQADLVALLDDLEVHDHKEDDQLFPAAVALCAAPVDEAEPLVRKTQAWHAHYRDIIAMLGRSLDEDGVPATLRTPWAAFVETMDAHIAQEEALVLPAILDLAQGRKPRKAGFEQPLTELQFEYDEVKQSIATLRERAPQAGTHELALRQLLDELQDHAHMEETQLFPAAMRLLAAWENAESSRVEQAEAAPPTGDPKVLRHTRGTCNVCSQDVPAKVMRYDDKVLLEKYCEAHGTTTQLLSNDPAYWTELDSFYFRVNSEDYQQRDYIVRMTETCNLDCPICLAKANTEDTPDLDLSGLEELLSQRRGIKIDLMAAEPTLRKDLEDWVRKVKATGNIAALHTNGLRLTNLDYARKIKDAGVDEVFLQFDGFNEEAHKVIRGRELVKIRMKALANLREVGLATSLIVVIARGLNEEEVGKVYEFAIQPENAHVREVFFLGLRVLGSARDAIKQHEGSMEEMSMMPDETRMLLEAQHPEINGEDVLLFNKVYFSLLSAFRVKKCLYVQHYMVERDGKGHARPISELVDLHALGEACDRYSQRVSKHPDLARARLLVDLSRKGTNKETLKVLLDMIKMHVLLHEGMNLGRVPERFLLLGFITACDPYNFDSQVAVNCGKGELSVDGGFIDSGAVANVRREARFDQTDLRPGELRRSKREERMKD